MEHQIGLRFEDGATRFIQVRSGETLADASIRQGIRFPVDCREGACGTCRCQVESGDFDPGDCAEDALSAADAQLGWALGCQMRPRSHGVVHVPIDASACLHKPLELEVRVRSLQKRGPRMVSLTLEHPQLMAMRFLPGQYLRLWLPDGSASRAYSFSSLVREPGEVDLLVRLLPDGRMSQWLQHQAQAGESLKLQASFGSFYLRPARRPLLMLAGGTGLGPMLAMLELLAQNPDSAPACHLLLGLSDDQDVPVLSLLQTLRHRLPQLEVTLCVSDPASTQGLRGHLVQHLQPSMLREGDVDMYVCGPPMMVQALSDWMATAPCQPAGFYIERFTPGA
ncbi:2Fe-2S iron-sulfur cluster-binding protein [Curvibacter sp. HBC28]|uniref:2Fe-2S iron-sulfur cluster-binding protein n=1 Tax=Curvibacter microcysteis TaxID=3026419 RepID=A0ABT5MBE3_9BURK|nr:2Fe-2S iron-sulfur cluster-binding protein [Curvibacter sp. HBC28]MDD0813224.1 2Fe-2S iron-sulfur cluster-binding protein [Curvibacter sp. HBC28]